MITNELRFIADSVFNRVFSERKWLCHNMTTLIIDVQQPFRLNTFSIRS